MSYHLLDVFVNSKEYEKKIAEDQHNLKHVNQPITKNTKQLTYILFTRLSSFGLIALLKSPAVAISHIMHVTTKLNLEK